MPPTTPAPPLVPSSRVEQLGRLVEVTAADQAWRQARTEALAEARLEADRRVADRTAARDLAIRQAFDAGVSKRQIGLALGTSSSSTVDQSLARTSTTAESVA